MISDNSIVTNSLFFVMLPSLFVLSFSENGLSGEIAQAYTGKGKDQFTYLTDLPPAKFEELAQKKIYFGHHSVGANIIDGIEDLIAEFLELRINIVKTNNASDFETGLFAHSGVGKNLDPQSKIDDFSGIINKGVGNKADIAGFKFCYVDMLLDADVDKILHEYTDSVEGLREKFPDLTIIHFTVPVTEQKTTWKHLVKQLLQIKDPWRYGPNINRNIYNRKLIERFQDQDPIFDIAEIESTYPDGTRSSFQVEGNTYYSLVPEYTYDGGHLNDVGRKKIAEQLIIFLANLD